MSWMDSGTRPIFQVWTVSSPWKCQNIKISNKYFQRVIHTNLKGQCHEIFYMDQFPQAPHYTIRAVSIFFENLQRYSQLKVHQRWQMEKIFNQKKFHSFIWTPLASRDSILIHFFLQVHFKLSTIWYYSYCLPPVSFTPVANLPHVSLIPVAIFHWRRCHRWQICRQYRWPWWQICHRYQQHQRNWWQNLPTVSLIPDAI